MVGANFAQAVAQQDVISELLGKSFAERTVCERKDILQHKKPLPWQSHISRRMVCQKGMASSNLRRLFCWPRLLFCPGKPVTWRRKRYTDMHDFLSDCKTHESSSCHLEAFKKWKIFDETERTRFYSHLSTAVGL